MPVKQRILRGMLTLAAVGMLAAAVQPAFADTVTTSGSKVWTNAPWNVLGVQDTAADSHSAYGNYTQINKNTGVVSSQKRLEVGGEGSTVYTKSDYTNLINSLQACTDVQFGGDPCSHWNWTYAA
jgi:hypothetical protein